MNDPDFKKQYQEFVFDVLWQNAKRDTEIARYI